MDLDALQNLLHSLQSQQDQQPEHHQPGPSTLTLSQPGQLPQIPLGALPPNQHFLHQPASQIPFEPQYRHQVANPPQTASLPTQIHAQPPAADIFSLLGALKPLNPLPITPTTKTSTASAAVNAPTPALHPTAADLQTYPHKRQRLDPRPLSRSRSPPQPAAHPHPSGSCPTIDPDDHPDPSQVTLSDALPVLSSLVRNNAFLDAIQLIKERQDEFELRLLDERNRIKSDFERNIKKLTQTNEDSSNDDKIRKLRAGLEVELNHFDRSSLEKWDHLRSQQQVELLNLNVPTFCKTNDPAILARQRQILEIILGALKERDEKQDQKQHQIELEDGSTVNDGNKD